MPLDSSPEVESESESESSKNRTKSESGESGLGLGAIPSTYIEKKIKKMNCKYIWENFESLDIKYAKFQLSGFAIKSLIFK